jgi:hypothetical protein
MANLDLQVKGTSSQGKGYHVRCQHADVTVWDRARYAEREIPHENKDACRTAGAHYVVKCTWSTRALIGRDHLNSFA